MYRIEISISPNSWTPLFEVSFSELRLIRARDSESPRIRIQNSGTLQFWGPSYEVFLNMRNEGRALVEARLLFDGDIVDSFNISFTGDWDEAAKLCELSVSAKDRYSTVLQAEKDKQKLRINPRHQPYYNVRSAIRQMEARFTTSSYTFPDNEWVWEPSFGTPPLWDSQKCYKGCKERDGGNIYIGDHTDSFCYFEGKIFAAKLDNQGVFPTFDTQAWRQVSVKVVKVYQLVAALPIRNDKVLGIMHDEDDYLYVNPTKSLQPPEQRNVGALNLYDALVELLNKADNTITINKARYMSDITTLDPEIKELFISSYVWPTMKAGSDSTPTNKPDCEKDVMELSLRDLLEACKTILNVDWIIDGDEFKFVHPISDCVQLPTNPENIISSYKGRNYSSGKFKVLYDEIWSETWSFSPEAADKVRLVYDNDYTDSLDYASSKIYADVEAVHSRNDKAIVMVATKAGVYDPRSTNTYYEVIEKEQIYNSALSTEFGVPKFHFYNRPYKRASFGVSFVDLSLKRMYACDIECPAIRIDRIDFSKLLITSYGNLMPVSAELRPNEGTVTIEAKK